MASLINALSTNALTKLNNRRLAGPAMDINADIVGRQPSGDPRIDLAVADRR